MQLMFWLPLVCMMFLIAGCTDQPGYRSSHPPSTYITGMEFDLESIVFLASGSDNWAITWGKDDSQYTTWGDGGGFNGDNKKGRVSMGVARIDGPLDDFTGTNVWGGFEGKAKARFEGKSYGILALEDTLWLWRSGDGSNDSAFTFQELFYSKDRGRSWQSAGVKFLEQDFHGSNPFFSPTFLQFGPGYQGSRDDYVYMYAPDVTIRKWDVQKPGRISLLRVPKDSVAVRERYEFFNGLDSQGRAMWSREVSDRQSVFSDVNGVMRTSVSYNPALKKYLLITQQVSRFREEGHIGIYEASQPWGPWRTVLFVSPWKLGLQNGKKSVYWNFSNKWSDFDKNRFVMVYTGPGSDNFGALHGRFIIN